MDTQALAQEISNTIPLATAIQLRVLGYHNGVLQLQAPLAPNINDKGCAFGGSLASVATLAGWGLAWLHCHDNALKANILVRDSQLRYRKPLFGYLEVGAQLSEPQTWPEIQQQLTRKGKARFSTTSWVGDKSDPFMTLDASYAILCKS